MGKRTRTDVGVLMGLPFATRFWQADFTSRMTACAKILIAQGGGDGAH